MKKKTKILIIVAAAAVVLAAVMLLLIFLPKGDTEYEIDEGVDMTATVDEAGIHQVKINTNENGEIENNSYGTLIEYVPADIEKIHLENTSGTVDITSYTPVNEDGTTEATVYTVVGFEDFDLQTGAADLIASAVTSLDFSTVISLDGAKSSECGFDSPAATATVTYSDGTKAVFIMGDNAPQSTGTYMKFGTGDTVYLVATDDVSALSTSLTGLISLTINDTPSDPDNLVFSKITLTGSNFPEKIVIEPNTNTNNSATNVLTSPVKCFASESESSNVSGAIRGLYATSVALVNPSDSQLKSVGLSAPYAQLEAVYPDETVTLFASAPDSEGSIYLMEKGGKVVYTISSEKLAWATTSFDKLMSEYVLHPEFEELSQITVNNGSKTYTFDISSKKTTTTDDDGSETTTTTTTVKYGNKEIDTGYFTTFFQNVSMLERTDASTDRASGTPMLTVTYKYASDGSTDTVKFYSSENSRYLATLNDSTVGYVYKTYINKLIDQVATVAENKEVDAFAAM